jgi:hypothetical protein
MAPPRDRQHYRLAVLLSSDEQPQADFMPTRPPPGSRSKLAVLHAWSTVITFPYSLAILV